MPVIFHKEQGLDLPEQAILAPPTKATSKMAGSRGSNHLFY
jgi:hypothetical protein